MTDLWGMVVLVIALLIGNLWLLKRNSKQQLKRKTTVSRTVQPAQTAAAVQTSPVVVTASEKNQVDTPTSKSTSDASGDSDGGAD
ncbi:hypothetical protein [Rheinheimera texasensis]|uniref:hypothetical protein n=1 Tax=Rheinheimera texasensis TaxID=306205 RepID=UPI0004E1DADB|nr:hypothetical protein [Rheinheimera texasensis]